MNISKKLGASLLAGLLALGSLTVLPGSAANAATAKPGAKCSKVNASTKVGGKTLICKASGKKLVWTVKVVAKPVTPKPPVVSVPKDSASAAEAWAASGWAKPASIGAVVADATAAFDAYTASIRNAGAKVTAVVESGANSQLVDWVAKGSDFVAKRFELAPGMASADYYDVIAVTKPWLVDTFTKLYDSGMANVQAGAFDSGNPAWGGRTSNTWASSTIDRNNMMVNDRAGMAQTAGHEYFHSIQENFANSMGTNCGPCGTPQWFWEGPAMFVGLQTAGKLGFINYAADGRPVMVRRATEGNTGHLLLNEVSVNTPPSIDPYGIGMIATEFLVSKVGMTKFIDIYRQIGMGKSFKDAFVAATGVPLNDFYLMFEDARVALGVPRN